MGMLLIDVSAILPKAKVFTEHMLKIWYCLKEQYKLFRCGSLPFPVKSELALKENVI